MRETGLNHQAVKTGNQTLVLRRLHEEGPMSRTDLAARCGLSKMTITNRIQELLDAGDIRECESVAESEHPSSEAAIESVTGGFRTGRRPILLETVPDARHAVSLYVSRDRLEAAVFNWRLAVKSSVSVDFPLTDSPEHFRTRLLAGVRAVLQDAQLTENDVSGIGVAVIGPADLQRGIILNPPNFHNLRELPVREWLEAAFDVPVFIDNDMNASAVAELLFGKGKGLRSFLYVGVTNGIGSGIILDGRPFRGNAGFAGELGHTTVSVDGPVCPCGNTGCLELYASIPAIVARIGADVTGKGRTVAKRETMRYAKDEVAGPLDKTPLHVPPSWEEIAASLRAGDARFQPQVMTACRYLSAGIVSLVNLFDPQAVFLGHELALAGEAVRAALLDEVHRRVLAPQHRDLPVLYSAFGHRSPLHGGAALVFDHMLHTPVE